MASALEAKKKLPWFGNLHADFLNDHGYLVIDNFFSDDELAECRDILHAKLTNAGGPPTSKESARAWVAQKSKVQRTKTLLDLVNTGNLQEWLSSKVFTGTSKLAKLQKCQVAFRFPGERAVLDKVPKDWYEDWHIDNFVQERKYQPKEYTLNIGIYLSDNLTENCGNFTVFPGMHHRVEKFSQLKGGLEYFKKHQLGEMQTALKLQKPHQITASKGSVILFHRLLPHTTAPNVSKVTREIVWYRASVKDHDGAKYFEDMWRGWTGVQKLLKLKNTYHPAFAKELQIIEAEGLGQQVTFAKDQVVVRVRNSHGIPCLYGSMVRIKYTNPKHFTFHTNGFIKRLTHNKMVETFKSEVKEHTLLEAARWISRCDYQKMIERWYPCPEFERDDFSEREVEVEVTKKEGDSDGDDVMVMRQWKFAKIKSRSKTGMMKRWADELELAIGFWLGYKGMMVIYGPESRVDVFEKRFECFHWSSVERFHPSYEKVYQFE